MMSKTTRTLITLTVLGAFGAALFWAFKGQRAEQQEIQTAQELASTEPLTGFIAVDVEPFFKDERVQRILAANKLPVKVTRIGSREMPNKIGTSPAPDFMFSSGVVAASMIVDAAGKAKISAAQSAPFHTPLVVASWEPIAKILEANGIAKPIQPKVYGLDMEKLTQLMLAKTRWKDLKKSGDYSVTRSVLVSTTDLRRSNSAAMYLALTSAALNGEVVSDRAKGDELSLKLAELFKRQGFQENYVNGNFDDYTGIGMGKTPMAFIYENQMVSYALQKKGVGADMVLMYPQPTIINKVVFVALNERAKALAELLAKNAELQAIAVELGFRIADADKFAAAVKPSGLAVETRLTQVIDPPAFDVMTQMIDVVVREMAQ